MPDDNPDVFETILASGHSRICLTAVPGCGKTTSVLLPKLRQILSRPDVSASEVLLLTFSRLSALDLKRKVEQLPVVPRAATVHSYALQFLLSENNHAIRNRVASIVHEFEKPCLISDLKYALEEAKPLLKRLLKEFSAAWATRPADEVFVETDHRQRFKLGVMSWLDEHECVLMEELLYHAVRAGEQLPDSPLISDPQFILVDEYQDLNELEQRFVDLLAQRSKQLLIVGDRNQSIYSFKFAYPQGIEDLAARADVEDYSHLVTRRCPRRVIDVANQLLLQMEPARQDLVEPFQSAVDGEVHFVKTATQEDELRYVTCAVAVLLNRGVPPESILVLAPRKKLGRDLEKYAQEHGGALGIPASNQMEFAERPELSEPEQQAVLLFALLANPEALLHRRSYVGLQDGGDDQYAKELRALRVHYGSLKTALMESDAVDLPAQQRRNRECASRLNELNAILAQLSQINDVVEVVDRILPASNNSLASLRAMVLKLREEGDTVEELHQKLAEQLRTVASPPSVIRIMTLGGSKGLDADHVLVLGCNSGNIPGEKRSAHLSEHEHRLEQMRLLYVAITRAKMSLTVSWARDIPFSQGLRHATGSVRTFRRGAETRSVVAPCDFLDPIVQHVAWLSWENG